MPRRKPWRTRADVLATSLAEASAREEDLRTRLKGTEWQLRWHKAALAEAQAAIIVAAERNADLELTIGALGGLLERERAHAAGHCTHAAELSDLHAMGQQVTALERRVHELQAANEGYEAHGWLPVSMAMSGGKRGRG